jgi:Holliday junction resolvase RusA-like endonuclease
MSNLIEDVVSFTVPLTPVSVNHLYSDCTYVGRDGYRHRGKKISPEAKAYKDAVAIFARGRTVAPATPRERRKVKYRVLIDLYLGKNQRLDADNGQKVMLDALEAAGVIHSDAFVGDLRVRPHKDDRLNPRTEYTVSRMEN